MATIDNLLDKVITLALKRLTSDPIDVYTFAFYHDHESGTVEICADTKVRSDQTILKGNQWEMKYFDEYIRAGKLVDALRFQAEAGRNLTLGDFEKVGLARAKLPRNYEPCDDLYLGMVRAISKHQKTILDLSADPSFVLFCASTSDAEVGIKWVSSSPAKRRKSRG